jgi:S1-C subfamily serine protease
MSFYELPQIKIPKLKKPEFSLPRFWKSKFFWGIVLVVFLSSLSGFLAGVFSSGYFYFEIRDYLSKLNIKIPDTVIEKEYVPQTTQEEVIIEAVSNASPSVVSIVATKDVPIIEQYYFNPFGQFFELPLELQIPQYLEQGTEKKEVGGGTGFIVSEDGLVLTNKHVVLDSEAEYTVLTNDGKSYPAKVLAKDPAQDIAVIKIEQDKIVDSQGRTTLKPFPVIELGNSDQIQIGQTVIAIGNALGEFRNTVSTGVVSGLARTITASGGGFVETIEDVIQTDAAINQGNSGGPLLNLKGEVIGINTATVQEAQSIGFAIPINKAKKDIEQVKTFGKIVYPFLGIRYVVITESIRAENDLPVNYGAWLVKGSSGEPAVSPDSAAQKAGLKENDIILEFGGEKITSDNPLGDIIMKYSPGDKVWLKVLRDGKEMNLQATLDEKSG